MLIMMKEKVIQYIYDITLLSITLGTFYINETKEVLALSTSFVVFVTACYRFYKEIKKPKNPKQ